MLIALSAKNKLCFVDGTSPKPSSTSANAKNWQRCNDMVFSWILNVVSSEIADSILYSDTAKSAWSELVEQFDQSNGAQLYGVHKKLSEFSQGNDCVTTYFTKLKSIWDEIEGMGMNHNCSCNCTCGVADKQIKFREDQKFTTISFKKRDNEKFAMLFNFNRILLHVVQFQSDSASFSVKSGRNPPFSTNNYSGANNNVRVSEVLSGQNQNFRGRYNNSGGNLDVRHPTVCNYCKKPGHLVDKCYTLQNKNKRYANNVHGGDQAGILGAFDASQGRPHSDNPLTNSQTDVQNGNSIGNSNLYEQLMNLLKNSRDHGTLAPGVANFAGNFTVSSDAFAYSSSWILDSGASDHMCSNKLLFSELHALPKAYSVSLPNGHIITINSVGTVPLTPQITLHNVLFIPSFKFNLLSVGKLCKELNSIILFTPDLYCLHGSSMKMPLVLGAWCLVTTAEISISINSLPLLVRLHLLFLMSFLLLSVIILFFYGIIGLAIYLCINYNR
ncbi:hypothetical protein RND81_03G026900 [Saponaria officinalis]|uniref:Retrovirus-related Pol polyprotein from transposon TNT 1-94-like beta-barrel domain-containing protein n=1 Tax=Saponaria officinalis TaxID=3572 RepID=A0AAW1M450_SAPOF